MTYNRMTPNNREIIAAVDSVTGKQVYPTATNNKLDVNATASLAGSNIPITGATTAVGVAIVDSSGNQITSFGGGTQYQELATTSPATGTLSLGRYQTSLPTLTNGQLNEPMLDISSRLILGTSTATIGSIANTSFAATQSGSWTVTANAGTNLNTSALALESGGNLAAIKADVDKIPSQGQALAAASMPVVLPAAQITTLTPPTTITANQGTATAVSTGWPVIGGELADTTGTFTNGTQTASVTSNNFDGYSTVIVSISGTYGTATGVFEISDDSGSTWYSVNAARTDGSGVETGYTSLTNTNRMWTLSVSGADEFRVRSTAVASGTVNVRISVESMPTPEAATVTAYQATASNFNATVVPASTTGTTTPTTAFLAGASDGTNLQPVQLRTNGDALGTVNGVMTNDYNLVYNGTNWDRIRSATAASGTTGTGLLGTGTMVYDGTNWQRRTVNSTTTTSKFAADTNILSILGTAPTTAGKLDVKGADGDVFVRNATAANFLANVTLQTQTDTVMVGGVNVKEINGVAPLMGNGTSGTGAQRVTIASDSTGQIALAAGSALVGKVGIDQTTPGTTNAVVDTPVTSGGLSIKSASTGGTATSIKASAGQLYGYHLFNTTAAVAYVQIFNVASGSVTLGTTTPDISIGIPASGGVTVNFDKGIAFGTAISYACTTTRAGSTGATCDVNFFYK